MPRPRLLLEQTPVVMPTCSLPPDCWLGVPVRRRDINLYPRVTAEPEFPSQSSVSQVKESHMSIRPVKQLIRSKPTLEVAGVHLRRAFGFGNTKEFDPFLLLDDFRNDIPEDYLAGFPWHPHRGIETITYVLAGTVQHGDSMGNRGTIGAGDIQWMTAGSGIIHQIGRAHV